jgi:hypothetical protein
MLAQNGLSVVPSMDFRILSGKSGTQESVHHRTR